MRWPFSNEPARSHHELPAAAAVVAAHTASGLFTVAWSGDAGAYLLPDGNLRLRTP